MSEPPTRFRLVKTAPLAPILLLLVCAVAHSLGETPSDWRWRAAISFPGYDRDEPLTHFPALVRLGSHIDQFDYAQFQSASGADLRFFSRDGSTEIPYEIEKWNPHAESAVWVRLPVLSNATDAIWACWGNSNALTPPAYTTNGAVWTNGYEAVWHLSETNGAAWDASRHGYNASPSGKPLRGTNGVAGDCVHFTLATSDYLTCGGKPGSVISDPSGRPISLTCWIRPGSFTQNAYVFSSGGQTSSRGVSLLMDSNERPLAAIRTATQLAGNTNPPSLPIGAWTHVAFTFDPNAGLLHLFLNGAPAGVFTATSASQSDSRTEVAIGKPNSASGYYFGGGIDEVRFSTTERSSNWVWAVYLNQASNAFFCAYGPAKRIPTTAGSLLIVR